MRAGLWQDIFFFGYNKTVSDDLNLKEIIGLINYRRIKYGFDINALYELSESRVAKKFSRQASFNALLASLFLEYGEHESTCKYLGKALNCNINAIDRYFELSRFSILNSFPLSDHLKSISVKLLDFYSNINQFDDFYKNRLCNKKIAVVGNAPSERGKALGNVIDAHDIVIRFNNFVNHPSFEIDYGKKLSIWVRTPSLYEVPCRHDIDPGTIIISSTLLLHAQNGNWQWMLESCDRFKPIVLFQNNIYRDLVQQLDAPPSAGLLTVASLVGMNCNMDKISFWGFNFNTHGESHYFDRHKQSLRHNWIQEKKIFSALTKK